MPALRDDRIPLWQVRPPLARVDLLRCYAGMPDDVVRAVVELGGRGLVIETLGGGGVPPAVETALADASRMGVVVVVTTRCPAGRVWERPDDDGGVAGYGRHLREAADAVFCELDGVKARVKLSLLLSADLSVEEIRARMLDLPVRV